MTDKKFTQKEVINALELCTNEEIFVCDQCVFQKYKMAHNGCLAELLPSTLALINRLKTRIVRYQLKNTNQRNALASLNKKVAEQKAEINELQFKIASCNLENVKLKAEIDRLLHSLDETNKYIPKIKKRAKTEAIKEFMEEKYKTLNEPAFVTSNIDNLIEKLSYAICDIVHIEVSNHRQQLGTDPVFYFSTQKLQEIYNTAEKTIRRILENITEGKNEH
jgi:uncharacterized coiled-coil protein SlyX